MRTIRWTFLVAGMAFRLDAQVPVPTPPIPAATPAAAPSTPSDSLPPFDRPNGSLLRAGTIRYQLQLQKLTGETVPLGTRTVVVADSALGGAAGWMIAESRKGTAVETTDSVYLSRGDLTPERWTATIGRSQFAAAFTHDSMFGAVQGYQGRASFVAPVPAGSLLSAGMVDQIAELLPLHLGYHAGATLILVDGTTPRTVPAQLAVDREDRVDDAGRAVDCWVLSLRWGASEERLWVDKSGGRVVRTEQATPGGLLIATRVP